MRRRDIHDQLVSMLVSVGDCLNKNFGVDFLSLHKIFGMAAEEVPQLQLLVVDLPQIRFPTGHRVTDALCENHFNYHAQFTLFWSTNTKGFPLQSQTTSTVSQPCHMCNLSSGLLLFSMVEF